VMPLRWAQVPPFPMQREQQESRALLEHHCPPGLADARLLWVADAGSGSRPPMAKNLARQLHMATAAQKPSPPALLPATLHYSIDVAQLLAFTLDPSLAGSFPSREQRFRQSLSCLPIAMRALLRNE
jgi:hypothetical protein